MGMMIFSFAIIFGILAGWTGALTVARLRGWSGAILGVLISAFAMAVFVLAQVVLLNLLGGDKTFAEVTRTTLVLTAALSFVWLPAFGLFYWRQSKGSRP